MDITLGKYNALQELLGSYGSCLVAYSGGVDSAFLARVAHEVLGKDSLAVIADSPSLPRRELEEALQLAGDCGFPVKVVQTREFDNPAYVANPLNRCYYCKHELFSHLTPLARERGAAAVLYGENASDVGDFRPGAQAALEFNVHAPLKEVGLTKDEIRNLSAKLGLPTAEKPQMACLSSRIPYGETVNADKLAMIERAEEFLRDLGFRQVRVRHHSLPAPPVSADCESPGNANVMACKYLARIELEVSELPRLMAPEAMQAVSEALRSMGYAHVTIDLQGYRRGSLNPSGANVLAWASPVKRMERE